MDTVRRLAELVAERGALVELEAWRWSTALHAAGARSGSTEAMTLADAVQEALVADGEYGLLDLVLAGSSVGGVGANDLKALVRTVELRAPESCAVVA